MMSHVRVEESAKDVGHRQMKTFVDSIGLRILDCSRNVPDTMSLEKQLKRSTHEL